jgi:hypothetical protein
MAIQLKRVSNRLITESFHLTDVPLTPKIEVRREGFFGRPNPSDKADDDRARHIVNIGKIAAAAEVAAAYVVATGYDATVMAAQRMEDTLMSCNYETRTRQVAEELYDPMAQLGAEMSIAVAKGGTREMIRTLGGQ